MIRYPFIRDTLLIYTIQFYVQTGSKGDTTTQCETGSSHTCIVQILLGILVLNGFEKTIDLDGIHGISSFRSKKIETPR